METGQSLHHPPWCTALSTSCEFFFFFFVSFLQVLSWSHSLFARWEAREEIWSSANYLVFISFSFYGKELIDQARYCVIKRFESCAGAGNEQSIRVPRLKLATRQETSCRELFTAKCRLRFLSVFLPVSCNLSLLMCCELGKQGNQIVGQYMKEE